MDYVGDTMDFNEINKSVKQFLEKQKSSIMTNPRTINLTIDRLELYVDTFHDTVKEFYEDNGAIFTDIIEKNVVKPRITHVDLEEKVKTNYTDSQNLKALSGQLSYQLTEYKKNIFPIAIDLNILMRSFEKILLTYSRFLGHIPSYRQTINGISQEFCRWNYECSPNYIEELIKDLHGYGMNSFTENNLEQIIYEKSNKIIAEYMNYFNQCLREYDNHFSGIEKQVESLVDLDLVNPEPHKLTKSDVEMYLEQNERDLIEDWNIQQRTDITLPPIPCIVETSKPPEEQVLSITIKYSDGKQKTIELDQINQHIMSKELLKQLNDLVQYIELYQP
ncbi:hypothetical protein [Paenibacillus odorifer]|uniref:hypothetical protein n=1 Tax=Paenibacillus odorifer TaxID=189426 RepID=UPI00096DE1D1|nr:hypothetical protein [Paenibacillus odorifer]OMD92784.1 hypothetical protein BSK67_18655 [Paenibacillus odorifer]